MIKLRGWLVVPTAPGLAAVHADDRALITGKRDGQCVAGIDPDALIVVATRRAFEAGKGFSGVRGFPCGRVRDINHVGIVRRNGDAHCSGATAADAVVIIDALPSFAGVIGTINARLLLRLRGQVYAFRIAGGNGNADAADNVVRAGKAFGDLPPGGAAIGGLVEAAAGNHKRFAAANFPRSDARRPKCREENLRVAGVHRQVGAAGVFIFIENFFEGFSAIEGAENAALCVRPVGMALHRNKHTVWIPRIDDDGRDLLGIAQTEVRPGFSRVG